MSPVPNNTIYGADLLDLIGEFVNLIHACEYKGVVFEPVDGFTLQDCRDTVNWYLGKLGFDQEGIDRFWSGE